MKKYIFILVVVLSGFSFIAQSQTKSFKRGVCFNVVTVEDVEALSPAISWLYNWDEGIPTSYDAIQEHEIMYVPMMHGRDGSINKNAVRALLSISPEIKYILGLNEPNFLEQGNKTPQQAVELWADLEEIADEFNLTIVGPALNNSPDPPYQDPIKWYDEFFALCPDCRVDHIAMHSYMPSAAALKSDVERYKKYNKPIWVTEFCAFETSTSADSQKRFMIEALDYLETDPDIYRYAWFKERGYGGRHPYNQLLDERTPGVLKELGEVFVHMSSYDDNFYFNTDVQIPAEHYIRMNKINMEKTTDESGHVNLNGMNTQSWIDYNVDIPEDGEYNIFFRISAEYPDDSEVYVRVGDNEIASILLEKKGVNVWNTQSVKGTFVAGKQKIRIGFKRGGLRINWWAISKSEDAPTKIETVAADNDVLVYPNPVKDLLNLQIPGNSNEVSLYDIYGKCVYSSKNVNQIDMNTYTRGMYILDIRFENGGRKIEKIIKEN